MRLSRKPELPWQAYQGSPEKHGEGSPISRMSYISASLYELLISEESKPQLAATDFFFFFW